MRRAVGLNGDDEEQLGTHLASFLSAVVPLDQQISDLGRSTAAASQSLRAALVAQRHQLVKEKVAALRQKLSLQGGQQFDSYIESMKAKIKFIPKASATQ